MGLVEGLVMVVISVTTVWLNELREARKTKLRLQEKVIGKKLEVNEKLFQQATGILLHALFLNTYAKTLNEKLREYENVPGVEKEIEKISNELIKEFDVQTEELKDKVFLKNILEAQIFLDKDVFQYFMNFISAIEKLDPQNKDTSEANNKYLMEAWEQRSKIANILRKNYKLEELPKDLSGNILENFSKSFSETVNTKIKKFRRRDE